VQFVDGLAYGSAEAVTRKPIDINGTAAVHNTTGWRH
jgi:hypothetical protein